MSHRLAQSIHKERCKTLYTPRIYRLTGLTARDIIFVEAFIPRQCCCRNAGRKGRIMHGNGTRPVHTAEKQLMQHRHGHRCNTIGKFFRGRITNADNPDVEGNGLASHWVIAIHGQLAVLDVGNRELP